jgi:hypothetical protein
VIRLQAVASAEKKNQEKSQFSCYRRGSSASNSIG